jgi:hypothetical protein
MAIDLTPGEIYFIGEVDVRTKEPSSYVKIGLVRERDDKRVDERVLEHQTGNPRQLTLLRSIKTPCVSKVENHLHRSFATSQVSGEWFHLDAQGLDDSMALCEQLAEDAGRRSAFVEAAKTFGSQLSNGQSLDATDEMKDLHQQLLVAKYGTKLCGELGKTVKTVLDELTGQGVDTSLYVTRQTKAGKKGFDEKQLQADHPDLYARFVLTEEKFKAGNLNIAGIRKFEIDPSGISQQFGSIHQRITGASALALSGDVSPDAFYEMYLEVLGHEVAFEWTANFVEAELKACLGESDEIVDVCKWKREMKTEEKFDKAAFSEAHPDLAEQYATRGPEEVSTVLHKGRGAIGA